MAGLGCLIIGQTRLPRNFGGTFAKACQGHAMNFVGRAGAISILRITTTVQFYINLSFIGTGKAGFVFQSLVLSRISQVKCHTHFLKSIQCQTGKFVLRVRYLARAGTNAVFNLGRAVGNKQGIYCLIYKGSIVLIYCFQPQIYSAVLRRPSQIACARYKHSSLDSVW